MQHSCMRPLRGAVTGLLIASKHSGVLIAPVLLVFLLILLRFYSRQLGVAAALLPRINRTRVRRWRFVCE